jgi:ribose transport system permease protein
MSNSSVQAPLIHTHNRISLLPIHFSEYSWIWMATILLFVVSALLAPGSVSQGALMAMLPFAGLLAIVAAGQTLVIQQRGIDMSAVGAIALSGVLVAKWGADPAMLIIALPATLVVSMLVGVGNGLLVTRVSITPIVATLASNALLIGAVRQISNGAPITAPQPLRDFASQRLLGLPYSLVLAVVFIVIAAFIASRTIYGRRFVAVGINPAASQAAGISAERYQIAGYALGGLFFGVTGILLAGFIGSASPTAGTDYLLPGIAAVVIGGTALTGGRGSLIASGVAALFVTQLGQLVLSMGASPAVQLLCQALAIVLAMAVRLLPGRLSKRR